VIVAVETAELREMMYEVIIKMIEDGELVPVYNGCRLVDLEVNVGAGAARSN
jgi:hypothetical protein